MLTKYIYLGLTAIIVAMGGYIAVEHHRISSLKTDKENLQQTIVDMGNAFNTQMFEADMKLREVVANNEINSTLTNITSIDDNNYSL